MSKHDDEQDFVQFGGRLRSTATASDAFVAQVRGKLQQTTVATAKPLVTLSWENAAVPSGMAAPVARRSARYWFDQVGAAAIILLILTIIASSMMLIAPDSDSRHTLQAPVDINAGNVNVGGNAGRTGVISNTTPNIAGIREDPTIPGSESHYTVYPYGIVVGNQFIYVVGSETEIGWVVSYDLHSQTVTWKVPGFSNGELASDGERVFFMAFDHRFFKPEKNQPGTFRMTALNVKSGAIEWQGPALEVSNKPVATLLVAANTVYGTDSLGNVQALDAKTGALIWQYPETPNRPPAAATPEPPTETSQPWFTPTLAANSSNLYVSQPDCSVITLDRQSGEVRATLDTRRETGGDVRYVLLQASDSHVVITAMNMPVEDPESGEDSITPATLLLVEPESLAIRHSTVIASLISMPVLTDDAVFVSMSNDPAGQGQTQRIDTETPTEAIPFGDSVADGQPMTLTIAGTNLIVVSHLNQVSVVDMTTGKTTLHETMSFNDDTRTYIQSALVWGNDLVFIPENGQVFVMTSGD